MKFALGKKLEMTQIWKNEIVVPVTKIKLEPGIVVQVKTENRDGYDAVLIGFGNRKEKNINKPQLGQMKGLGNFRYLKEFRYKFDNKKTAAAEKGEFENLNRGDRIEAITFEAGDVISVSGVSKGKGFQGGVKRHGFHGQDTTHGTKDQVRMPGSVGAGEPQHVFKGLRMAGRMGNANVTIKNLEVVEVMPETGEIYVKGAVPGARNGIITILGKGELKFTKQAEIKEEPKVEEVKEAAPEEAKPEENKEEAGVKVEEKKEEVKEVKEEVKEAPKAEEKKEEPKAEEKKEEEKKEEAPKEKKEKAPEEKFENNYLDKFNHLPAEEKAKYATAEFAQAVMELEDKHKIDLVPAITKVIVKEVALEDLAKHLVAEHKVEEPKAAEMANDIKEKIFK